MNRDKRNEQTKGYLMVLAAGSLWGTIGLFATLLSDMGIGAAPVAFFRLLSATIMLALILLIKGKGVSLFRISKRGLISCMLIGFVSQAFYNVCYMNAIEQNGMATAAVFLYTSPIYVALLSRLFFHEPLSGNKILAILVNIIGCVLTVTGGAFSEQRISAFGLMMGILAGFTYAMLPNKAVSIAKGAFANCPNLFYIYIPMQTEDIDPHAFDGVSDLTILGITGSAAQDYAEDYGFIFKPAS